MVTNKKCEKNQTDANGGQDLMGEDNRMLTPKVRREP